MLQFKSKFSKFLSLAILLCVNSAYAKVIIWDLGDTLLKADHLALAGQIGIGNLLMQTLVDWKNPMQIGDQIFDILNIIEQNNTRQFVPKYKDKQLPESICKWLEGRKSGVQIYKDIKNFIAKNPDDKIFSSSRNKKVVKNSAKAIFTPRKLAKNMKPIKSAVRLLEKCVKNNHKIILFSNFDTHTFSHIKKLKRNRRIFKNIRPENIMISGNTGLLKPDPKAFQLLIDKYKLDPKECYFVDDQINNVETARKLGMNGIVFESSRKLSRDLKACNII